MKSSVLLLNKLVWSRELLSSRYKDKPHVILAKFYNLETKVKFIGSERELSCSEDCDALSSNLLVTVHPFRQV